MKDLNLIDWLGIGGFFLSIISIAITIILDLRRTKGNIQVSIKSVKKSSGKEKSNLIFEVEIVNRSLEKRFIKDVFQYNMFGRWVIFLMKIRRKIKGLKFWFKKESFEKYRSLERGEELILKYSIQYLNENFSKKVYLKLMVIDSLGKRYKSKGMFVVPSELKEEKTRGALLSM